MERRRFVWMAAAFGAAGCKFFQIKGTVTTTKTVNGKTTTTTREFENWEEMKAAMDAAGKELRGTTKELIAKLTEAPPPGEVKLSDLAPALADYEGSSEVDFVSSARASGEHEFNYVQIGVPTYDGFFKAAAEFHAFVFQTRETVRYVRELVKAKLGGGYQAEMSLGDGLRAAATGEATAQFDTGRALTVALAQTAPQFVEKTQNLVASGQQLISGAAASITNPKTVLHLDLITKGLGQSVKVVAESGKLLVEGKKDLDTVEA